jgi:hypothetical protein
MIYRNGHYTITRRKNADNSGTLIKHIDRTTLPYSGANLTTMQSRVIDPLFVLQRIDANDNPYPFTPQTLKQY